MAEQTNRVTVKVNGDAIRSKPGASVKIGGIDRTDSDMTDQGQFYFKPKWVRSEIKVTLIHMSDTDLAALRDSENVTVTWEPHAGKTYTMANAVCAEVGELKDGECEITFFGDPAKGG